MKSYFKYFLSHPLFSGSIVMIAGSNFTNVLNYLYHLVMGRLLVPQEYGELAALFSLIGLIGILPFSLGLVIVKYISSAKNIKESTAFVEWMEKRLMILAAVISVVILLFSPLIADFLNINSPISIILISTAFFFAIPSFFYRSALQGYLKFKESVISTILEVSLKLILGATLVILGFSVNGALGGLILASLFGWLIGKYFLRKDLVHGVTKKYNLKQILKYYFPVIIQSLALTSLISSDLILVKHFFSAHDTGLYAAISVLGKIIYFAVGPISSVMFPIISKRNATGDSYRKVFLYSLGLTALLASAILFVYWLFPELAINMLYGVKYIEASSLLLEYGVFITFYSFSTLIVNFYLSIGKVTVVIIPLIAAISQVVFIWFLHSNLDSVILISSIISIMMVFGLWAYSYLTKTNG